MIKIIICDDHPLITEGLKSFIENRDEMQIVATATSAAELWQVLEENETDVLILDISLPDGNGVDICAEVKKMYPHIKVIALSNHDERSFIVRMLGNKASGYLIKSTSIGELEKAIKEVYRGGIYFGEDAQKVLVSMAEVMQVEVPPITKREKEVLEYISQGLSSPQIAEKMFISSQTVDSHRKNLMAKFGVNKTISLVQKAKDLNFLN